MRCRKLKNRLFLLAVFIPFFVRAQVTADCSGAIVVCGDRLITLEGGPGTLDFNNPNNDVGACQLTGETESVWLYFRFRTDMPDSSIIEFTIDPVEDGEIDYDFSLYDAGRDCDNLGSPVRCSYAWVFSNNQFDCGFCPLTGLGNGEIDESEGPFGNGYLAPLAVYPGQGFYLYVNEFYDDASISSGFNISFGGSAAPYLDCLANPNCTEMVVDAGRDTTVCSGDIPFQLIGTATFSTGYEIYTWTGTNGEEAYLDDPHSPQPTVTFPDGFQGEIVYVVTVESGDCVHSDTLRLNVLSTPSFSITGPTSFCEGETITLTASPGFDSYRWSDNSTAQRIEVVAGGTYAVTVTASGNNCAIAKELEVTAHPLPEVNITGDSILCAGDTILLDAGPAYSSYQWQSGAVGRYLPVLQAGTYTAEVVDTNGCTGSGSRAVIEVALPEPDIAGPDGLCPDEEAPLSVFATYTTYLWSTGDISPQVPSAGPGLYSIEVWDEYGCRGADTLEIAALPGVDPQIFGPDTICFGTSTPLAVSPVFESYLWSTASTASSILVSQTGDYSITVTNAEGCAAADTLSLLELPPINLNLNILGNPVLCTGDTLFLQATSGFDAYEWQNGAVGPIVPVVAGGNYSVEVTDALGCTATAAVDIEEASPPQPVIDGPAGLCPQASANLQVGTYASYLWSDGSTGPELPIGLPGTYAVTVSDNNGCTGTDGLNVAAYSDPVPAIIGPSTLCEGTSDTLAVSGGPFTSFVWQDNTNGQQLVIDTSGNYSVTVANAEGCLAADTLPVQLLSQPQILVPPALTLCENESLTIDLGPGFDLYEWSTGGEEQSIVVSMPGIYSVTVTADNGCRNNQNISVASVPNPEPEISGDLFFCQNTSSTLAVVSPGNYVSINWSTGSTQPEETFVDPGQYTLAVTDSNGCTGNYAFHLEELGPTPVDISGDTLICDGETSVLDAGAGYSSYLWSNGSEDPSISVTSGGTYFVTITNALGCEGYDTLGVRLQPLPEVILPDTLILCEDGELTLDAGAGPYTYSWASGQDTPAILIDEPGIYEVEVSDALGCAARDRVEVLENEVPSPQIDGTLNLCPGDSSILTINQSFESYQWSTGDTTNSVLVTRAGFYTLTVTDAAGCEGSANILVNGVPAPVASITGPQEICEGSTAILDAGAHTSYLWSNGYTGPLLSTTEGGLYNVVVSNSFGCRDTAWAGLMVLPLPEPGLEESATLCEGGTVALQADSNFIYYFWEDGSSEPVREVDAPGMYVLIVSDGTCSGLDTIEVVQQPAPEPVVLGGITVCPDEAVTLEVLGDWPALNWPDGSAASTLTVTEPGTYTVTVEDSLGCPGTGSALVEHFQSVPPVLNGDPGFCPGESANLSLGSTYALYNWSTGSDASSINVNSPGIYSVTVTDSNGCSASTSQRVLAYAPPQAAIGGETGFCAGESAQVFAFGTFPSYAWSTGDSTKLIVASQPGDYSVTVTNDNGCKASATVSVSEWALPQPPVLGGQFCLGDTTVLYVGESFVNYLWEDGSQNPTLPVSAPGLYGLTVTDINGCIGSVVEQVEELPLPEPEIIGGSPICLGMGATTNISVEGSYPGIRWNTGDQTPTIAVGTTDVYSVVVTDSNGCQGEAEFTLETLPAPSLDIQGDTAFCENSFAVLEVVTDGASLLWSTGDTSGQVNVGQPGTYTVTAFGENGCETVDSIAVEQITLPLFDAGGTQAIDCREEPVQLGSFSNLTDGMSYNWSGPGISANNRNEPRPWVAVPGLYTLEVVQSDYQCPSLPAEVMVEDLRYEPQVVLQVEDTLNCTTPTITLDGQGSAQSNGIIYQWYDDGNNLLTGESGLSLAVSEPGTYTLLVLDTLLGCSATASIDAAGDYAYPQVEAGPEGLLTCETTSVQLAGWFISTSTELVYNWTTPDGNIVPGPPSLRPEVTAPGLYILTVEDLVTGCESSDTVRVREDIEAPVADAGESQAIDCLNQEAVLDGSNSSQGAEFVYEWHAETGVSIGGTLQPTVDLPGIYYLAVTNLNNGCRSLDTVTVFEAENYLEGMQVEAVDPLCFGDSNGLIAISDVQGGTGPFLFSLNGGPFASQQQFLNLEAGAYEVMVQDAAGCEYGMEVLLEDGNDVQVRLGEDMVLELGDEVTLQALTNLPPEEIRQVNWTFPIDTFPCLDSDCLIKDLQMLEESTLVRATVMDLNGCTAYDELHLIVKKERSIFIPNAFSPNGDGANDRFTIFADMDEVVEIRRLMIMDRWGEQVFARSNFLPNDLELGWDGTLRDEPLNPAVFVFFAEIEFVDGEVALFEGSITLVR